jgi:hypothetical protein
MTLKEKVFIVAYCKMNPVAMTEVQGQELSVGALNKVKFDIEKIESCHYESSRTIYDWFGP